MKKATVWTVRLTFLCLAALAGMGCSGAREVREEAAREKINVGYGSIDKDLMTGAASSVDVDAVQRQGGATSLASMLQGRVSGVYVEQTGGGLRIRVRGATSVMGSSEPLFVLDGIPLTVQGGYVPVNPTDIASITVLKDAASTSIYGSRGANGVIVITTRR